jgi:hypothetical protein
MAEIRYDQDIAAYKRAIIAADHGPISRQRYLRQGIALVILAQHGPDIAEHKLYIRGLTDDEWQWALNHYRKACDAATEVMR